MKSLDFYKTVLDCNTEDQVFDFLISNLKPSNRIWSYFVNWEKVFKNTKEIELSLNSLNYLIGKEDFDNEFRFILKECPKLASVIPALVVRGGNNTGKFEILVDYKNKKLVYEDYDFSKNKITEEDIEKYLRFVKETGLIQLFTEKKIKNLVDYMIGVEAGLDSNGRKNRGGTAMEHIVEIFIEDICNKNDFRYCSQANAVKIKSKLNYIVPVNISSRRYDFAIDNGKELFLIETNFYGGGGSKIKSTAGEYTKPFDELKGKYKFIWITDGIGWKQTTKPLREIFNHVDYLFNLAMLEKGILEHVLK